jgi:hypothetical protein
MHKMLSISALVVMSGFALCAEADAQGAALPSLAGTYKCQPQPVACRWGDTVSITPNGNNKVALNNGSGSFADAKVTSNITLSADPPFNSEGVILPDHSIQWSNGTHWVKQ